MIKPRKRNRGGEGRRFDDGRKTGGVRNKGRGREREREKKRKGKEREREKEGNGSNAIKISGQIPWTGEFCYAIFLFFLTICSVLIPRHRFIRHFPYEI